MDGNESEEDLINIDLNLFKTESNDYQKPKEPSGFVYCAEADVHLNEVTPKDLEQYDNYIPIFDPITEWKDTKELPIELYPHVRQRSSAWFSLRSDFRASDLSKVTGVYLKKTREYMVKGLMIKNKKGKLVKKPSGYKKSSLKEFVDFVQGKKPDLSHIWYKLEWGVYHECNAIKALFESSFFYNHDFRVSEVGSYGKMIKDIRFIASPDGLFTCKRLFGTLEDFTGTIEIKCRSVYSPKKNGGFWMDTKVQPFNGIPDTYIDQVQKQMDNANVDYALFISWTPSKANFFIIEKDVAYIKLIDQIIEHVNERFKKGEPIEYVDPGPRKEAYVKYGTNGQTLNPFAKIKDIHNAYLKHKKKLVALYESDDTINWSI